MGTYAGLASVALFLFTCSAPAFADSHFEVSSGNQATTFRGAPPPDLLDNSNSGSNANSTQNTDTNTNNTSTGQSDNTDKFGKEWLEQQLQGNEPRVVRPF